MRYAELCAGYGGLSLAIEDAFPGAELAWYSEFDPAPSKIMAAHWPGVPNHGDMTQIDWSAVEPVDLISGGTPCFPAGTLIDTTDGYRPIEDIRLGDMVRTHAQRYMPVVQLMDRQATDTLTVKVMGSPAFITTEEHPFYVRSKGRIWNNERRQYDRIWAKPEWIAARDLTKDHFVGFQIDRRDETVAPLGDSLAYIIGRWLGDGWVRNGKRTSPVSQGKRGSRVNSYWWQAFICCAHEEADDLANALTAAGYRAARIEERTVTKFRIDSQGLVEMLLEFGSGASGKRIPGWVYRLPSEDQRALWRGWADSDGSVQKSGQVRVTTVSEQLAHGMARVARNAYRRAVSVHHSPMPSTCVIEGRTVNQRDQFQVCLPVANREAFIENDWCWVPVRSIKPSEPAKVYNFGVQDDESYTAWGITVHNCQDLSHAGRRRGMTEGTRSNLWVAMREAIATIRPTWVVWENVRGAYSAKAERNPIDHEPCVCGGPDRRGGLHSSGRDEGALVSPPRLGWNDGPGASTAPEPPVRMGRNAVSVEKADRSLGGSVDVASHEPSSSQALVADSSVLATQDGASRRGIEALLDSPITAQEGQRTSDLERASASDVRPDPSRDEGHEQEGAACRCKRCGGCVNEDHRYVEHCPGCMGDAGDGKPSMRALERVLGDLADLGFDAEWRGLRAADVGAPHGRFRVFVLARRRDAPAHPGRV